MENLDDAPTHDLNETSELMRQGNQETGGAVRPSLVRPGVINTDYDGDPPGLVETPNKRPTGRTPSSRQALQDRINNRRNRKEEKDPNTPSGGAGDYNQKNNRRKELLKLRQQARQSGDEEDNDDNDDESPVRGKQKAKGSAQVDEEPQHSLVTVMLPPHIYPLEVLPSRRSTEARGHPVLVMPAPHPHTSKIISDCFGSLTRCCSDQEYFPHYEELKWGEEEEAAGAVLTAKVRNPDSVIRTNRRREQEKEIGYSEMEWLLSGSGSEGGQQEGTIGSFDQYASPLDAEMSAQYQKDEGLFIARRPLLTSQLMDGEEVCLQIANMVARDLYLSRITQRILRDVCGTELLSKKRKEWLQLEGPPADPNERKLYEGNMKLLKIVNTLHGRGPVLRVFEDPVDEAVYEPIVDNHGYDDRDKAVVRKKNKSGRDMHEMQFGANSTKTEMLGHIPEWSGQRASRRGRRGILRVHVQSINLTNHALMNAEEKKFIELKKIYSNYRIMFEQQATGYLVYRLHALLHELSRLSRSDIGVMSDEAAAEAKIILSDVLETLPSLAELREGLTNLTNDISKCWGQLKEIRKQQRFVSTRAVLIGRPLYFLDEAGKAHPNKNSARGKAGDEDEKNGNAEESSDSNFYQHLSAEVVHWNSMQDKLEDLPELVENLCFRLRDHAEHKRNPNTKNITSDGDHDVDADSPYGLDFMASVSSLTKQAVKALQGQFLPLMVYRLTNLGLITNDPQRDHLKTQSIKSEINGDDYHQLDPTEEKRRRDVSNLSIKLVLKVNGRVMTSTEPSPLQWPSYTVNILRSYEFRVFKHLASVTFDIYFCTKGVIGFNETIVGTIPVPLPYISGGDVSAQNLAPVAGWCSFSASNPTLIKNAQHDFTDRIQGAILCGSEYEIFGENVNPSRLDGVKTNFIPSFGSSKASDGSGKRIAIGSNTDFTRERDFQNLLPDTEVLDPNDPQNEHLMRLKKQFDSGNQSSRDTFVLVGGKGAADNFSQNGNSYANFLKTKVPDRIRLLMMRESRPYLFTEPIPLSEAIIQKSEFYRSLLAEGSVDDLAGGSLTADVAKAHEGLLDPIDEVYDDEAAAEFGEGIGVPVSKISTFLQRVRDSHTAVTRQSKQKKIATNSVISEPIQILPPEFSLANILNFAERFEPKRALKPKATGRKATSAILSSCDLLIQVNGSKNVPLRTNDGMSVATSRAMTTPVSRNRLASIDTEDFDENSSMMSDYDPAMGRAAIAGMSRPKNSFGGGLGRQSFNAGSDLLDKKKLAEKNRARTFVEVRFQDKSVCTSSVEGGAPNWKQSLSLEIQPPQNDFSPQSMETLQDNIYFTLFDEIIQDDSQRGGRFEDEATERVEKRYLGSFSVPFATVFNQGCIDGVFRLDVPAFNMGYNSPQNKMMQANKTLPTTADDYHGRAPSIFDVFFGPPGRPAANADTSHAAWDLRVDDATEFEFDHFASGSSATYLKVLITLNPLLTPIIVPGLELSPKSVCSQDRFLVSYAHSWLSQLKSKAVTKDRDYNIFGYNSDGYKVLSCRYLTPQEPPMDIQTRRGCLHLTSMIPFMPDAQAFIGAYDLWCTSKQMWEMGACDEEEHGITLYNFLSYLSSRSGAPITRTFGEYPPDDVISKEPNFFVVGRAIPEGDSVYVLCRQPDAGNAGNTHNAKKFILINPCTGYVYSTADRNCPMLEITTLATPYNIWANVQASMKPSEMNFNVLDPKCWKPFFCKNFQYPKGGLTSVQEPVHYVRTAPSACIQIEREIKGAIKTKFRRWRSKRARSAALFHPGTYDALSTSSYCQPTFSFVRCLLYSY